MVNSVDSKQRSKENVKRKGATMLVALILLPVLLMLAAFAINIAHIEYARMKTQIVADAAVRAANGVFLETQDKGQAVAMAQQMASLNPIDETVIPISSSDLEFGLSERKSKGSAYVFRVAEKGNSVRLRTQSFADGAGAAIPTIFPTLDASIEIRPLCTSAHTQTTLDVAVVVDRSGSMAYAADENSGSGNPPVAAPTGWASGDPVPPNSRWLDLVASVNGFCSVLETSAKIEKVGLCGYSSSAATHQTLTDDYSLISNQLNAISWEFHGGSTNVGDGILDAVYAVSHPKFCRPWATNAIVLMSDGNHNTGTDPLTAANQAVLESIPIYTVSFSNEANQSLMQQIADLTGGTHYHAVDAAQLNEAFRKIAQRLPSMLTE